MTYWLVGCLAAFLLGMSKGGIPVIAILAVPLMALFFDPAVAAGLLLPLYIIADWYAIYLFRKSFSVRNLKILIPAAVIGIVAGYFAVAHVDGDAVKLLLSLIGFGYLANAMRNRLSQKEVPAKPAHLGRGIFWGALAGLTSYVSHSGGPPYQAYVLPQKLDKMAYLGTTALFFAAINLMKAPPYILAGQMTFESIQQSLWLAPAALAGAWTGARISRLLPEKLFYALVEIALLLVSIKLFWEVVVG